jgi:hypothetical protein
LFGEVKPAWAGVSLASKAISPELGEEALAGSILAPLESRTGSAAAFLCVGVAPSDAAIWDPAAGGLPALFEISVPKIFKMVSVFSEASLRLAVADGRGFALPPGLGSICSRVLFDSEGVLTLEELGEGIGLSSITNGWASVSWAVGAKGSFCAPSDLGARVVPFGSSTGVDDGSALVAASVPVEGEMGAELVLGVQVADELERNWFVDRDGRGAIVLEVESGSWAVCCGADADFIVVPLVALCELLPWLTNDAKTLDKVVVWAWVGLAGGMAWPLAAWTWTPVSVDCVKESEFWDKCCPVCTGRAAGNELVK